MAHCKSVTATMNVKT